MILENRPWWYSLRRVLTPIVWYLKACLVGALVMLAGGIVLGLLK